MTRPVEVEGTPRAHLRVPAHWPYGELEIDHPAARYVQSFCAALRETIGPRSLRAVSRDTGVSHGTLAALLRGDTWPDVVTVSKIEWRLGVILWPGPLLFAEQVRGLRIVHADYLRTVAKRARVRGGPADWK